MRPEIIRSLLLFPTFRVFGAVFGLWPETLCREPGESFTNSEAGAHPPRVLLDAPRVQPLACATDTEVWGISMRPLFSARARKTAPEAGALPINFGVQV